MYKPIIAKERSKNPKIGVVNAIYAPLSTCSNDCPFRERGCYARNGNVRIHANRCTTSAADLSQLELAEIEAVAIRNMDGKRPLRLHVSGDFFSAETAAIIDSAAADYTAKYGQPVWAYTHNWRNIDRSVFRHISILASCETPRQATQARARGYAVALVVAADTTPKGVKICPALTHETTCLDCKLCFNADKLKKVIGFYPHGAQRKSVETIVKNACSEK